MQKLTTHFGQFGATLTLLAGGATAQISIGPATSVPTGAQPSGVAMLDLNGDGNMDLATTTDGPDRIDVHLGNGAGTFGAPVSTLLGAGTSPHALVARDFDGDGDTDLAVSLKNVNQVRLVMNQGGVLTPGASAAAGLEPRSMSAGDIDGDGDADLAVANRDSNDVTVFRNDGGALTSIATLAAGQEPRDVAFGDWDGDGDMDLAASAHDSRTVHLYTNTASTFAAGATLSVGAELRPVGLAAADLDGDGDADLATATSGNGLNFVSIFTNSGGVFAGPANFASGGINPDDVIAADFNIDGDMDLATSNEDSNSVGILAGLGGGTFGAPLVIATGVRPGDLVAGDVDSNGSRDLVSVNRDSNDLSVMLNQGDNPVAYCIAAPNSAGPGALMSAVGSPDISANNFAVAVSGAPANKPGLFYFGTSELQVPFGDGFRCVGGATFRYFFNFTDANGAAVQSVDFTTFPSSVITPGSTVSFQYWFRDQVPAGSGFNLSDGLRVAFGG